MFDAKKFRSNVIDVTNIPFTTTAAINSRTIDSRQYRARSQSAHMCNWNHHIVIVYDIPSNTSNKKTTNFLILFGMQRRRHGEKGKARHNKIARILIVRATKRMGTQIRIKDAALKKKKKMRQLNSHPNVLMIGDKYMFYAMKVCAWVDGWWIYVLCMRFEVVVHLLVYIIIMWCI